MNWQNYTIWTFDFEHKDQGHQQFEWKSVGDGIFVNLHVSAKIGASRSIHLFSAHFVTNVRTDVHTHCLAELRRSTQWNGVRTESSKIFAVQTSTAVYRFYRPTPNTLWIGSSYRRPAIKIRCIKICSIQNAKIDIPTRSTSVSELFESSSLSVIQNRNDADARLVHQFKASAR